MTTERSKRRDFLSLIFISKPISKKLLIKILNLSSKNVIHRPRSVRIGRKCALGLSTARGRRPRAVLKTSGTVSPNTDFPAGE